MTKAESKMLADQVIELMHQRQLEKAFFSLNSIMLKKIPFRYLDYIGSNIGKCIASDKDNYLLLLDRISASRLMGGYVIIGQALVQMLHKDICLCFNKAAQYMVEGNEWYICDIIGERVLGHALTDYFDSANELLVPFVEDENCWIKRSVGVAVHYFSKRERKSELKVGLLLELLEPQLQEKDIRVLKGIGWGLKTVGRYYPSILTDYMRNQVKLKKISSVIIRKCVTYLDEEHRKQILDAYHKIQT